MFAPSQEQVRRFFCEAWAKHLAGQPLTPLEAQAADWMIEHPEYHQDLSDVDAAIAAVYTVEEGRTNPFLHLSMHLSVSEQCSIDQPPGIRQAVGEGRRHVQQVDVLEVHRLPVTEDRDDDSQSNRRFSRSNSHYKKYK